MTGRALIVGVGGQDGAYLAKLLVSKGYAVHGTSRADAVPENLARVGATDIRLHAVDPLHAQAMTDVVRTVNPDEIYYLAAQSSVAASFEAPAETFAIATVGLQNVLSAAREVVPGAAILHAASGDCFGATARDAPATEESRFAPRSPYGAAKCAGHHLVSVNRLAYGQRACSAFLFSHESPLRPERFVIGKIVAAVRRIRAGSEERLELGALDIVRDWGWAPEYVEAMWLMLQPEAPGDYVIATGRSCSLGFLVEKAFAAVGIDWRDHVVSNPLPPRPADFATQYASPERAAHELGWRAAWGPAEFLPELVRAPR